MYNTRFLRFLIPEVKKDFMCSATIIYQDIFSSHSHMESSSIYHNVINTTNWQSATLFYNIKEKEGN